MAETPEYLSPGGKQVVKPGMTPCQQAQALNEKQFSHDAVKSLAHGLPEQKAVQWAGASAEKVASPAHKADMEAILAAKAWAKNPTAETQKAASLAAAKTDFKTPGAWAAQAAAFAGSGKGLTAHAVSGAVLLAAAQGGKPISPPGAAAAAIKMEAPKLPGIAKPAAAGLQISSLKKPAVAAPKVPQVPQAPQVPKLGPDGLNLTPAQRSEMAKNCEPFLKLGCQIGHTA